MPSINFPYYTSTNRVPGTYVDIDGSQANTVTDNQRYLLVGQVLANATNPVTPNVPVLVSSYTDAVQKAGSGSMLVQMYNAARAVDSFGELWFYPIADNGAGSKATQTVTISGTATGNGTLNVYINGTNVQVPVSATNLSTTVAANLVTAINQFPDIGVTASATSSVVTLTALQNGVSAGDIDARVNYLGAANNEVTPAGINVIISVITPGSSDPVIDFSGLGDLAFDYIAFPYTGAAALTQLKNLLNESNGRWSWKSQLFGIAFNAFKGSAGATTTFGLTQNDKHISTLGIKNSPTPVFVAAAIYMATAGQSLRADPALPLTQLELTGLLAPSVDQVPTMSERNTFYYSGISSFVVQNDRTAFLERAVTNYQKNPAGINDNSWLDVETDSTLAWVVRYMRERLATRYARKKLANDGTPVAFGSNIVTPSLIKADMIGLYRELEDLGYVQDTATFARRARATNAGGGQCSLFAPVILINQLREVVMLLQFTKP